MTSLGATPLDISRMGGPQRAEREAAALTSAAERATAPPSAPVSYEEVSCQTGLIDVAYRILSSLLHAALCMHHVPAA